VPGASCAGPVLEAGASFSGHDVVRVLERTVAVTGVPASITLDHGSEFMSKALEAWAFYRGIQLGLHPAGQAHG
jgi:putative transposase